MREVGPSSQFRRLYMVPSTYRHKTLVFNRRKLMLYESQIIIDYNSCRQAFSVESQT